MAMWLRALAALVLVSNGKVKIIASTENPEVIDKVLKYLGLGEASQAENR